DGIEACLQRPVEFDLLLIQPMLNELERFLQYFVHVHWPEQWFCRACEPKQLIDQRVDPVNLVHDQAGKGFAEIRLVVALRKELSESLDRNQRVLNLVCHSGRERPEAGEAIAATNLQLEPFHCGDI